MAQAEIGSLRVRLSMDAGEFRKGLQDAEGMLGRLASKFGIAAGVGSVASQALVNSVRSMASGLTGSFKGAVDGVSELVDASSKFGIPIQQLAGLKYAAELSGASFEQLGVGAGKLAKNLTEIAGSGTQSQSPAAKALTALGISAKDASGHLKNTDDVMIELAGKFAGLQDGSAKTAIAMMLFGKSGAQLIPTLNLGSAELAKMRDEAKRLGLVLDDETARGVEAFGDEWDKVKKRTEGFWIQLTGQLLPALQLLVKDVQSWLDSGGGVQVWARTVGDGIKTVVDWTYAAGAAFSRLRVNLSAAGASFADFFSGRWSDIAEQNKTAADEVLKIDQKLAEDLKAIWSKPGDMGPTSAKPTTNQPAPIPDAGAAEEARAKAQKLHNAELERYFALRKQQRDIEAELNPVTAKLAETQDKLGAALQKGAIDAGTYGMAMARASAIAANSYAGMAGSIVSDLGTVFENNKAVAIAAALINTFQSVTNAWANVPFPLNIAAAGASLAAGMAQVANIRSTTKSGGGGGGSSGGTAAAAAPVAAAPQQSFFIDLQGENYSRTAVRGLIEQINNEISDGAVLRVGR